MKSNWLKLVTATAFLVLSSLFGGAPEVQAQQGKLQIEGLDRLGSKASESVDVNLEGLLLQMAAKALSSDNSTDGAKIKALLAGLKGVYVRQFEFEKDGEYSESDLKPIRDQLKTSGWSRLVGVKSKKEAENLEVYGLGDTNNVLGVAIISAEPKELLVVNIVGAIDLDKLADLAKHFRLPEIKVEQPKKE